MTHASYSLVGIVKLDGNQDELEQGNKLAVLGGDYLLSQACGKLAEFRKPQVRLDVPRMLMF